MNTTDTIQAGDQIVFHSFGTRTIETVEKTTKTQIIVNEQRFRRSDGHEVGSRGYTGRWISRAPDTVVTAIRNEDARRDLLRKLDQITHTANYSGADLNDILDQLTEATNDLRTHLGK